MTKILVWIIDLCIRTRYYFYRLYLKSKIGDYGHPLKIYGTNINLVFPQNITLGKNVAINGNVYINATYPVVIQNNVAISDGAKIITITLNYNKQVMSDEHIGGPVHIGNNVQIGANAIILPNVTVGDNVVIAAGCVITNDVESNVIMGGVPGRLIKKI